MLLKSMHCSFSVDLSVIIFLVAQTKSILFLTILIGYQTFERKRGILSKQYNLIINMCTFLMHVLFPPIGGTVSFAKRENRP